MGDRDKPKIVVIIVDLTLEEVVSNPDEVLGDEDKLRELIKHGDWVAEVLKVKEIYRLDVEVDGRTVTLTRPTQPIFKINNNEV